MVRMFVLFCLGSLLLLPSALRAQGEVKDPVADAIAQLHDAQKEVRIGALQRLAGTGLWDDRAVNPIIELLKTDTELDVRTNAALALGFLADARALDVLIPLLAANDLDLRQAAIDSLGMIGDGRASGALQALASADNGALGSSAVQALARIGDARAAESLHALMVDAQSPWKIDAAIALCFMGDQRAVDVTLARMKGNLKAVTPRDLMVLATALDPQALPVLLSLLTARVQLEPTLYTLSSLRDGRAVDAIVAVLRDEAVPLQHRATAAYALGEIRDTRATQPLLDALQATNGQGDREHAAFRQSVLLALATIDDPHAAEALLAIGNNDQDADHVLALNIFKMLGNVKAIPLVEAAAKDEHDPLQWDALLALAEIPDKAAVTIVVETMIGRALNEQKWEYGEWVFLALEQNPAMTFDDWRMLLTQNGGYSRAVSGLAATKDPRVLDTLVAWVSDREGAGAGLQRNYERVTPVIKTLGEPAVQALLAELRHPDGKNKSFLIALLGEMGDARVIEEILPYLNDEKLRASSMIALAKLKAPTIFDVLMAEAEKTDGSLRQAACWGLGLLGDARAHALLLRLLGEESPLDNAADGSGVRGAAADALGMLGHAQATDGLVSLLQVKNTDMRISASLALGKVPPEPRALKPLIDYLMNAHDAQQVYYGYTAIPALLRYNDRRVLPFLLAMIQPDIGETDYRLMQRNLFQGMAESNDTRVLPRLLMTLSPFRDEQSLFDLDVVKTLGARKQKVAVPALLRLLKDSNPTIRIAALESLQAISGETIGADHAQWVQWWLKHRE